MTQIAIVLYPGFTALDVIGPYEVLRFLPHAEVRFVWHETGPITADSGVAVLGATHTLAETPRPDIVVVPGGSSSVGIHARDKQLLAWLGQVHETTVWTSSVCAGSVILAAAGLLTDQRATSHWQALPSLHLFGVTPVGDERIVFSGRVVTSAGVSAGIDLALWIAGKVGGTTRAEAIQLAIEYDPQPPFDAGHLGKASTSAKTLALVLLAKESVNPAHLSAITKLAWTQSLAKVRNR
ncbi:UNVERIFIED_CONTAM: DJ-1/PfpI family protein [Williamsia faeni]